MDAPVNRTADPRARTYIVDFLPPGTVIKRRIEVNNTSDRVQHVALYAAGAAIDHGDFAFAPDRTGNELSSWISLDQPAVDVAPHGTKQAVVTIAVPANASAGERYAVVWAEASSAGQPGSVQQINRVGVRVYLDIGPGGEPPSDFAITRLTPTRTPDGRPILVATVHNTGGRALDMTGSLDLRGGPGGITAGPFPVSTGTTLAIGDTQPVRTVLPSGLPNGPWTVHLTLASGTVRHDATATLTFPAPGGVGAGVVPQTMSNTAVAVTTGLLTTAAVLVVLPLTWWLIRRVRRSQP